MKNNRIASKRLIALYALCAVLWNILAIMKAVNGASSFDLGITIFCAIIWTVLMAITIYRYRTQQYQGTDNEKGV